MNEASMGVPLDENGEFIVDHVAAAKMRKMKGVSMDQQPRVFFIERPKPSLDIEPAKKFGEISFVFNEGDRRASVFDSESYGRSIVNRLREVEFNPQLDLLCISGKMVPVCIATAAIISAYDTVQVLLYNASLADYVKRTMSREFWRNCTKAIS